MDPLEPGSERMIAEVDGHVGRARLVGQTTRKILAQQLIAGSTETRLWRIDVESGNAGCSSRQRAAVRRAVDVGDRSRTVQRRRPVGLRVERPRLGSDARVEGRSCDREVATADGEGVAIEAFAVAPVGTVVAVVVDRGATSELQFIDS